MLLAGGATAAAADVMVVRATGPSAKAYPAGKQLADNSKITLKQNDLVVLLDAAGTKTLRGPGTFTPSASAAPSAAPAVLAASTSRRARIGAVRSVGLAAQRSPTLWHLDVTKSSNFCIAAGSDVTLWRADPSQPVTLTVTPAQGRARTIEWAAGQSTVRWPAELPTSEGSGYKLSWKGATAPTSVKFRTLASVPQSLDGMASTLIERGCSQQLDLLIASVPEDKGAPTG